MKVSNGSTSFTKNGVTGTTAPRSFADYLTGKSTTKYTRPTAKIPTQKTVNKAFKSWGPTSNGKGVGM